MSSSNAGRPPRTGTPSLVSGTGIVVVIIVAVITSAATTLAIGALRRDDSPVVATGSNPPGSADATVPASSAGAPGSAVLADTISGVLPAAVTINTDDGSGSGIVVADDGWILTNRHVVDCNTRVDVTFDDGRTEQATVSAIDSLSDLALIRTRSGA